MAKRLVKILLALLTVSQIAATCHGTETGNPGGTAGPSTPTTCPTSLRAAAMDASKAATMASDATLDELILRICQKIIGCGVATTNDTCANALNGEDGDLMIDELGFTGGTTILQLRQALLAGTLDASGSALVSCEADLNSVNCSAVNPIVTAADFSQVETFIPNSCSVVYSSPEASSGNDAGAGSGCP